MENMFGKTSGIHATASVKDGKTFLSDLSFTAPYKIMKPFQKENGGIRIMPLCASAGIMAGDAQEFSYLVREGAELEVLSQSFEKIHKMDEGKATRSIEAQVERNAVLCYYPQPVIPFAGSSFESRMVIRLTDESSHLFMLDIISCGRTAHDERFQYRRYASDVLIYRKDHLIYRDHTVYEPEHMEMEEIGMYEGYTHMANIFLTGDPENNPEIQENIWSLLESTPEIDGGITRLHSGDYAVRIFGMRAQKLQETAEKIKEMYAKGLR